FDVVKRILKDRCIRGLFLICIRKFSMMSIGLRPFAFYLARFRDKLLFSYFDKLLSDKNSY
ncbi:hypothetical protein, partial [Vibrio parahaemolyticus]|uniref:hypothetical protein n=1 Tax=Vibrio parahaemolyticus TaxID=670 RepID=UPI001E64AC1C